MNKFVWVGLCIIALGFSLTLGCLIADKDQTERPQAINTPPSTLIHGVKLEPIRTIVSQTSASSANIVITPEENLKSSSASSSPRSLPKAPTGEHGSAPNHIANADYVLLGRFQ